MGDATAIIIGLIVAVFLILVIREIVCWYWKVNKMVDSLENIERYLDFISEKLIERTSRSDM